MMQRLNNSDNCLVCGLRNPHGLHILFHCVDEGHVTSNLRIPEHMQNYPGIVHGGIVAAILDEVAGRSLMTEDQSNFWFTRELVVTYKKQVPVNTTLIAQGWVRKHDRRISFAESMLLDADDNQLATAEVKLVKAPKDFLDGADPSHFGWRYWSDEEVAKFVIEV